MNDTAFFLNSGFEQVVAVDGCPSSCDYATKLAEHLENRRRLSFWNVTYADFFSVSEETESFDIVHSNFALPYHGVAGFNELMVAVTESVKVGGIFSGVFFGDKDGWRETKPNVPLLSKAEVATFFKGFEFLTDGDIEERTLDGHLLGSEDIDPEHRSKKFWHTLTVIARRVSPVL